MATKRSLPYTLPSEDDSPRPVPAFPISYERTRLSLPSSYQAPKTPRSTIPSALKTHHDPFLHDGSPLQIPPTPMLAPMSLNLSTPPTSHWRDTDLEAPTNQETSNDSEASVDFESLIDFEAPRDIEAPNDSEAPNDIEPSDISSPDTTTTSDFDYFAARARRRISRVFSPSHPPYSPVNIVHYVRHFLATSLESLAMVIDSRDLKRIVDTTISKILSDALDGKRPIRAAVDTISHSRHELRPETDGGNEELTQHGCRVSEMLDAVWRSARDITPSEQQQTDEEVDMNEAGRTLRSTTTESDTAGKGSTYRNGRNSESVSESDTGDEDYWVESVESVLQDFGARSHGGSGEGEEDLNEDEGSRSGYSTETETVRGDEDLDDDEGEWSGYEAETEAENKSEPESDF